VIEGYLDIVLAIMLYVHSNASYNRSGDVIDLYLVLFFSVLCSIIPVAGMIFLCANRQAVKEIEEEDEDEDEDEESVKEKPEKKHKCLR